MPIQAVTDLRGAHQNRDGLKVNIPEIIHAEIVVAKTPPEGSTQ